MSHQNHTRDFPITNSEDQDTKACNKTAYENVAYLNRYCIYDKKLLMDLPWVYIGVLIVLIITTIFLIIKSD